MKVYGTILLPMCPPPQESETVETEESFIAKVKLEKHVPVETNTHATTEELLDSALFMRYMLCQIFST
jgi:hypothetical protein